MGSVNPKGGVELNMKKKLIIVLGAVSLICIIILVVVVLQHPTPKPVASLTPSPTPETTPPLVTSTALPDDLKYGQALTILNTQYPWYSKLPLETTNYEAVYDFNTQSFRIRLKVPATATQEKSIVAGAVFDLQAIGVPAPVKYYVVDLNGNQL